MIIAIFSHDLFNDFNRLFLKYYLIANINPSAIILSFSSTTFTNSLFMFSNFKYFIQQTEFSISNSINLLSSTAYSIGRAFTIGSINPDTIIFIASPSLKPLDVR